MRILFLTPWFPSSRYDQVGNFILDSAEALANLGHEITILVSQSWKPKGAGLISKFWIKKKINIEPLAGNIKIHICEYFSVPRHYLSYLSYLSYQDRVGSMLSKLILKYQCQLIHAHSELPGLAAVDIGKEFNIPTIITLHGISTENKLYSKKSKRLLFDYSFSNANRIIMVGDSLYSFFSGFVNDTSHFRIVENGYRQYKLSRPGETKKFQDDYIKFISVSNLHEGKGIDINLHALAKIKNMGINNWNYKIIGEGYQRSKLEKIVTRLQLSAYVKFYGGCQHNEVYKHLKNADVFILPSYREAFGIAYVEAMAHGLLAIAVEGQGPSSYIKHDLTGLLVKENDLDNLVEILYRIFHSPEKSLLIALRGQEYVKNNLTWDNHAKKLTDIYNELIGS